MRKRILITVVAVLLVAIILVAIRLTRRLPVPEQTRESWSLAEIRALADGTDLPVSVSAIEVGTANFPPGAIGAAPDTPQPTIGVFAFVVHYVDDYILIDSGYDAELNESMPFSAAFDEQAMQTMEATLRSASSIVFTHEHFDHIGGAARSRYIYDFRDRLVLTSEQMESDLINDAGFPPTVLETIEPLQYDDYYALRPGIVLVKAPGHTPGSQMIYVRLFSGAEFLFIGDIVMNKSSIDHLLTQPAYSILVSGANGERLASQLRALVEWSDEGTLNIVPSHDRENIKQLSNANLIRIE